MVFTTERLFEVAIVAYIYTYNICTVVLKKAIAETSTKMVLFLMIILM